MQLILASSSKYRRSLLERLALPFSHASPDIDESRLPNELPDAMVVRLASAKAARVLATRVAEPCDRGIETAADPALIIGSDQAAVCDGEILGKPGSAANAIQMLRVLRNKGVDFLTGLAVLNSATGAVQTHIDRTTVRFRDLSEREIIRYVELENPVDCAGAIKSEGLGITLLTAIDSVDPTALIGLPLIALSAMLRAQHLDPLA